MSNSLGAKATLGSNIEFDTPANRIISQFAPKNQFRIDPTLPDLAFLRQLSVQGRLFQRQGFTASGTAVVTLITLTPAAGETFFIYSLVLETSATVTWTINNGGKEITFVTLGVAAGAKGEYGVGKYFDSIVGDGIKTYTVTHNNIGGAKLATMNAWRENTSRIRDASI